MDINKLRYSIHKDENRFKGESHLKAYFQVEYNTVTIFKWEIVFIDFGGI